MREEERDQRGWGGCCKNAEHTAHTHTGEHILAAFIVWSLCLVLLCVVCGDCGKWYLK